MPDTILNELKTRMQTIKAELEAIDKLQQSVGHVYKLDKRIDELIQEGHRLAKIFMWYRNS